MEHLPILLLIGGALALFALEWVRADVVALGVTLILTLAGTVSVEDAFAGFSSPAVITVVAMFILSAGLIRTGVADFLTDVLVRLGGGRPIPLTLAVMGCVGAMSAFMNNIAATAILLPAVFAVASRSNYPVSRLLIPVSFGSLLGGLVTLIGTPPNLIVSNALEEAGFASFRMFDYLPTGLAVAVTGALYMAFIGRHLIPERRPARSLAERFELAGYVTEVVVPEKSPLAGQTLRQAALPRRFGIAVVRIRRAGEDRPPFSPTADTVLAAGDRLVVEGSVEKLLEMKEKSPLRLYAASKFSEEILAGDGLVLAEAALAPGASLVGRSINQGHLRRNHNVLALGLRRRGRTIVQKFTSVPLAVGDVLLVQGTPEAIAEMARSSDFLVTNRLDHAPRDRRRAPLALAIMAAAIAAAATGLLHISVAGMAGVFLMALTGCVRVQDLYGPVEWRVVFLIALMMPLGTALDDQHTGTAHWLADHLVLLTGDAGPLVVLAALFLFATAVTEVMSNAAASVLLAPIGIAIATSLRLEPHPFLMAIAIGASTTFLTPIGHQANVLVYGVGNYRFSDFPRTGALLNVLVFAVTVAVIPVVWPFRPLG